MVVRQFQVLYGNRTRNISGDGYDHENDFSYSMLDRNKRERNPKGHSRMDIFNIWIHHTSAKINKPNICSQHRKLNRLAIWSKTKTKGRKQVLTMISSSFFLSDTRFVTHVYIRLWSCR
jgi:hypothetical protein